MKPALTVEEWNFVKEAHVGDGLSNHIDTLVGKRDIDEGLHAAAAIALYECCPPRGFTRGDLDILDHVADIVYDKENTPEMAEYFRDEVREIRTRIEALLPPEEVR